MNTSLQAPSPDIINQIKQHLFHPGVMAKHLTDLGFDVSKLRQLKKKDIAKAQEVLDKVQDLLSKYDKTENVAQQVQYFDESQEIAKGFYTIIQHLPTAQQIPLDKHENIVIKGSLLKSLSYVVDVLGALDRTQGSKDFLNDLYGNLKYTVNPISKDDPMYKLIEEYGFVNAVADNSTIYPEVNSIFRCESKTAEEDFQVGNKALLWYGDRVTCLAGVLSNGFNHKDYVSNEVAPAYCFSDSVIKAMSLCYLDRYDREAFLLLCEVALGDTKETAAFEELRGKHMSGHDSVNVTGKMVPKIDEENKRVIDNDVRVPVGKLEALNKEATAMYNNFMVYNNKQIKLRYIVKFDIKYLTSKDL